MGGPLEAACVPVTDPALTVGFSVFETLRSDGSGQLRKLDEHLDRLERSAAGTAIALPAREILVRELREAAAAVGVAARIRVTVSGSGLRIVSAEVLDLARFHLPIRAARGHYRAEPYLGGSVKHGSRAPWMTAVRRAGVDEVLMVDADGRFTEGTSCAILAVIGGALWTAPHDGRILESTTCLEVIERAVERGIPVVREGPPAAGPWDGLYVASTTRDLAPVVELDGAALPSWDAIGTALAGLG